MSAAQTDTEASNVDTLTKPWTVKNVSWEDRNAAIAAADRSHETIGEWLSRAIRAQVQEDLGRTRSTAVAKIPEAPVPSPGTDTAAPKVDLDALERLVMVARNASDERVPVNIQKSAYALVRRGFTGLRATSKPPKVSPAAP